jgi:hypothetical protein
MFNSNDYSDNAGNARVTMNSSDAGSIYDTHSANATGDGVHLGGLNSGGLTNERNQESNKQWSGRDGVLGNFEAKTESGDRVISHADLKDSDIVSIKVPGGVLETDLRSALNAGILVRDANGQLRAVTEAEHGQAADKAEQEQNDRAEQMAKEAKGERNDEQTESFMKEATASDEGMAATADLGDDIIAAGGELSDKMIENFANAQRMAPAEAKARIAHVMAGYTAEASRAASRDTGYPEHVCQQALYEAREDTNLQQLARQHFGSGKPNARAYGEYVLAFVADKDSTSEGRDAIVAANPGRCRLGTDGTVVVRLDSGQEVSWRAAVLGRLMNINR